MSNSLFLLVDAVSLSGDRDLPYLLSFSEVDAITVEHQIKVIDQPVHQAHAVLGSLKSQRVHIGPLQFFQERAAEISARPSCAVAAAVIERALLYAFLARKLGADAVVSPARTAFGPSDVRLLGQATVVTIPEALAIIGAHVRQRSRVPLGGSPALVQHRTEVYPLTARSVIPIGQAWWSSCVKIADARNERLLSYGEAVFRRLGQALRGRDGVHEALRRAAGRPAILDALYHFDVVLTSSVGALDALAFVAHEAFRTKSKTAEVAWQRSGWIAKLADIAPSVAGVVAAGTYAGTALRILTNTRNSIHGIPLDEYLHVEMASHGARVEHRVRLSTDLGARLRDIGAPLAPLEQFGLFVRGPGVPFLNLGAFSERLLEWTVEIISGLQTAMMSTEHFPEQPVVQLNELETLERQFCVALAAIGKYPHRADSTGIAAEVSVHRTIMRRIDEARRCRHREGPRT